MTYKIEDNWITERVDHIFDNEGREYYLNINRAFEDNESSEILLRLYRCHRELEVGRANCLFDSPEVMFLADIIIDNEVDFLSPIDKLFKLTHWNEPKDYRRKGLGTYLLKYIIELARNKGIKKIYGLLTHKDISDNPNLINWYQKHGFRIEDRTSEDIKAAKYRSCLYLQ